MARAMTGSDLKRYNPESILELGEILEFIEMFDDNKRTVLTQIRLHLIQSSLTDLCNNMDVDWTSGTRQCGHQIGGIINFILGKQEDETDPFDPDGVRILRRQAEKFRHLVMSDFLELNIFMIPAIQAYNTTLLLERGERILLPDALSRIETYPQSLDDIRLSTRALAVGLWTACGFHIARATELLLREYWKHLRSPRSIPAKATWGTLCKDLQGNPNGAGVQTTTPAGDQKVIAQLVSLGTDYRNPLVHPEHSLDEQDGTMLFEGCKAAIAKMLSELP